jgi:hypothetical protein
MVSGFRTGPCAAAGAAPNAVAKPTVAAADRHVFTQNRGDATLQEEMKANI